MLIKTSCIRCISFVRCMGTTVNINSIPIHYERVGKGSHNVLLLPGAMGSAQTDFQPQLSGLNKDKYTVICWDPPGYGKSRPPERCWTPADFFRTDALAAHSLMSHLSLLPFSVLGWSDGGNTAMLMALLDKNKMIKKMLIWGCNSWISPEDKTIMTGIRDVSNWSSRMREPFEDVYGKERFRELTMEWVDAFVNYPNGDICKNDVHKITHPTLIVHGGKDPVVPSFHPEFLHKSIAGSQLVTWPDAKHNLHLRYPDDFNKLAEEFLDL